jgi:hypothetical protein
MPISINGDFASVASTIVELVAADDSLEHVRKLRRTELEAMIYCILRHFARWRDGDLKQVDVCVALMQNVCFVHSIPLFESSGLVYAIRDRVLEDIRIERLRAGSSSEPHGLEEEGVRFFDLLVFELIRGY